MGVEKGRGTPGGVKDACAYQYPDHPDLCQGAPDGGAGRLRDVERVGEWYYLQNKCASDA